MNVEQMRSYISNAYPGDKWKARCRCMRRNQVIAIYYSMLSRKGKMDKHIATGKAIIEMEQASQVQANKAGFQLTIFDMLKEV